MSWAEYKKKREEQENMEMSYSQENNDSNNETSSWQKYKQKREKQKVQQTETLPVANKANTVQKTTTNLTEADLRKIEQNSGLKTGTLNLNQMQAQQQKFNNLQQKGNEELKSGAKLINEKQKKFNDFKNDTKIIGSNLKDSALSGGFQLLKTVGMMEDNAYNTQVDMRRILLENTINEREKRDLSTDELKEELNNSSLYKKSDVKPFYQEKINKINQRMAENTEKASNPITKKIAGLSQSIGNNAVGGVVTAISPTAGFAYFTGSAMGSYYDEAVNERGMSDSEARNYATIMGLMEGATEKYLAAENIKGAKKIMEGTGLKNSLESFGLEIGENFVQEAVMPAISELATKGIAGNEHLKYDFRTENGWKELATDSLSDGIDGALSAILLSGTTRGVASCVNLTNKARNGGKISKQEIKTAISDAQKSGVDVETILKDKIQENARKRVLNLENETPELPQNVQNNIEQQTIQTDTKTAQNQNISQINGANENNLKNTAINEVNSGQTTQNQEIPQLNNILNNKELPMQSYVYEKSDNPNVDILRKSANKYLNNSEQAHKFVQILEKISQDKNVEIIFDADLKTPKGKIANGSYSNGVITINPNSTRAGEFIAIHELTHAIGTKQMENIIEKYSKSNNIEFNEETKKLLQNYSNTEMNEEALADISGQLFGTQEFINNISQNNPNVFQRIYSEIKYLWHQFKGYKTQDQFIDDLYYKWTQAYNSNNKLNETNKYYIETIEDFDEMKYNNIKELRLPKQEYAILSGIVNSDSNIKPGRNYVETTNATYEVYFKDTGEFKVVDKIVDGGYNDTITNGNIQGTGNTRNAESGLQVHSSTIQQSRTRTRNDEISNFNKKRTRISDKSSGNGSSNSSNVKYSIQESENNSGSFNFDNKGRELSKEQQEYFKNSKVRDENGNLQEVYHGSNTDGITIFDIDKTNEDNVFGKGFYFTDNELMAESYAEEAVDYNGGTKQIYKGYLNIKNPFVVEGENTVDLANKIRNIDYNADIIDSNYGVASTEKMKEWLISKGYDGIEVKLEKGDGSYYVAFNSNQIKRVDNISPTSNSDIRYSQNNKTWQDYLEKNYKTAGTRTNLEDIRIAPKAKKNILATSELTTATQSLPIGEYTGKQRKHYKSIMESAETTPQAKKIAKELLNSDTYVPETNKGQLERADARIMSSTPESELNSLSAKAINGEKISSVDIAVGERLIQYYSKTGNAVKLQEAIQTTAMAGTSAGQTVQALSLLNHQTPQGQAMWLQKSVDKMNNELARRKGGKIKKDENGNIRVINNKGVDITEKVELFNLTPEMIQNVVSSKNDTELNNNLNKVYEQLGQQVTRTTAQKIDAWRYFSMLANPRTHIRNITGNLAMGGVQGIKNKVAGVIEGVTNKINPDMERSHTIKPASKEVKAFAKADIENVTDRLGLSENKYNPKTRLENSMRTFKSNVMENTVGKMFDLNNKALEVEDGWGLKAGYAKALSEYMTANNLTPDTITDKQLGKARNYAIQQAKEATFHQDSSIASLLNQLSNKNKFSKFILDATLPFKKTPINVAKAGLEYSPIGLVKSAINDTVQLRKGNITVNTYIDNISKGLTGSGIALVGYALADCGILKATGSDDEDREKFEESRGSQNYSVTIGDNTYSLDWLAPSGIPLFIGAECYELMQAQKEKKTSSSDEDELYNKTINTATNILDSFANAMNPMTEMSMLSGLTSALKSYDQDSSKMLASIGTNAVKSYVNQFVPTALGQVAKTTDQYERSTTSTQKGVLPKAIDTTRTQIMNKIPGLRQMLPIKTDIWGNEIEQSDNVIQRAFENAVFPWARKELNSNSVDKELVKVYKNTGDSSVLPDSINKDITINKQKYTMTSGEYSKYKKQYGENSYKLLNGLVTSNGYKKMSDEEKRVAISKIYSYATEQIKVDYAKQNGLEYEQSTLSQVTNAIKKVNGNTSNYFEFIAKTQELDKDIEKIKTLANSNYDENTKKAIYENSLGKRDNKFNIMKETFTTNGLNTTKYLKYKSQEFESDKTDDGTLNGKTVNGSKKKKVWNYIEQMDITYTQKLLLYGLEYTPSNREQTQIVNYINSLPKTQQEKLEMLSKFQGFTIYKDGTFKY